MSVSIHAKAKKMVTYEAPNSEPAYTLWRAKMWWETTFPLAVMEPWEQVVFYALTITITLAVFIGLVRLLPGQLHNLQQRATYYLFGDTGAIMGVKAAMLKQ